MPGGSADCNGTCHRTVREARESAAASPANCTPLRTRPATESCSSGDRHRLAIGRLPGGHRRGAGQERALSLPLDVLQPGIQRLLAADHQQRSAAARSERAFDRGNGQWAAIAGGLLAFQENHGPGFPRGDVLQQQIARRIEGRRAAQPHDHTALGKQRIGQGDRKSGAPATSIAVGKCATTQLRSTSCPLASAAACRPRAGPRQAMAARCLLPAALPRNVQP